MIESKLISKAERALRISLNKAKGESAFDYGEYDHVNIDDVIKTDVNIFAESRPVELKIRDQQVQIYPNPYLYLNKLLSKMHK